RRLSPHQGGAEQACSGRRSLGAISVAEARQLGDVAQARLCAQGRCRRRDLDRRLRLLPGHADLDEGRGRMAKKPAGLIYGVDDVPPWSALALLAVQHIFLMSSTLVLPIVLVSEIGGDFGQVEAVVALTMMACGIGTILQAMRWRGIGSGYLCPNLCGPNFFAVSLSAAWLGGLPPWRGVTSWGGVLGMGFARV